MSTLIVNEKILRKVKHKPCNKLIEFPRLDKSNLSPKIANKFKWVFLQPEYSSAREITGFDLLLALKPVPHSFEIDSASAG